MIVWLVVFYLLPVVGLALTWGIARRPVDPSIEHARKFGRKRSEVLDPIVLRGAMSEREPMRERVEEGESASQYLHTMDVSEADGFLEAVAN